MKDLEHAHELSILHLSDIFTPAQEAQLAYLLAELIAHKWGTLEIEIVNGTIRFFRPKPSIEVNHSNKAE